jgi:glycosyltransferase involved in cell wall biosynthesis
MSVSLITFANLGKKTNLRTTDILPIIETFEKRNELKQVVCQINGDFYFRNTYSAIPDVIRYPMRAIEKIFKITFKRRTIERLFDFFTALRLKFADVTFLHGGHVFPRAARRARALGSITVDISASAYVTANKALEKEEFEILNIKGYEGWYSRLVKEATDIREMDYRILMSEFTKRTYVEAGYPADRIFIAHIDVDTERFAPVEKEEKGPFQALYLAHTQPLKGLHYLLDAWESLSLPDAELQIIGMFTDMPPELSDRYLSRIEKNKSIKYMAGTHTPEEYLRNASVFVFPSLTEGFGRVTLEAMSCGLPVITTEHATGLVEDGKTGYVIPIRNSAIIAEKLKYLYENRDVLKKMSKEARHAVETKKPFGEAVLEIYQEILLRNNK